jgi:hypothetical protein
MHLNPSNIVTESRAGMRQTNRIPPPAFLSRDLQYDWDLVTTVYTNFLLIGTSSQTGAMLDGLAPYFREPISRFKAKAGALLPEPTKGTLIVLGVHRLDSNQQAQMLRWMDQSQSRVQVVSTSTESLFSLVQSGDFSAELYYRLNVMLLDVTA